MLPRSLSPTVLELVEQRAGLLARHVALEQVAGRIDHRVPLPRHVGDPLGVAQGLADPVGQVGGRGQAQVGEHLLRLGRYLHSTPSEGV